MKVLRVNDYRSGGGAELTIEATRTLLAQRGVEDHLFTIEDVPDHRRTPLNYVSNRAACRALRARLESLQPDLVHLHNFYHELSPAILAELIRHRRTRPLAVVMTAHDMHLACPNAGGSWFSPGNEWRSADPQRLFSISYLLSRRWDHRGHLHSALRLAQHCWNYRVGSDRRRVIDLVICSSRFVQDFLQPLGLPTTLIHPPLPRGAGEWQGARTGRRSAQSPLQFIFAGRIEPEKGLAEFLADLPAALDWRLVIVGEGSDLPRCRRIVETSGLSDRVEFTGRLSHDQTLARIAQSHVLIQPSLCQETYGRTLIEALGVGTSILVSDRGALPEIVRDSGIGFIAPPNDPAAVNQTLAEIHHRHREGRLNSFDAQPLLAPRDAQAYVTNLLTAYDRAVESARQSRS